MLTDHFATLEQARWLAAHGYPQDQWPQMAWEQFGREPKWVCFHHTCVPWPSANVYAAPLLVGDGPDTVLGWLEATYDIRVALVYERDQRFWLAYLPHPWPSPSDLSAPTATALLDTVMTAIDAGDGHTEAAP